MPKVPWLCCKRAAEVNLPQTKQCTFKFEVWFGKKVNISPKKQEFSLFLWFLATIKLQNLLIIFAQRKLFIDQKFTSLVFSKGQNLKWTHIFWMVLSCVLKLWHILWLKFWDEYCPQRIDWFVKTIKNVSKFGSRRDKGSDEGACSLNFVFSNV